MTKALPFLLTFVLIAALSPAAQTQDFETTEIADDVYRFRWVGHNALFVVAGDQVVVFDPINTEAAAVFAQEIQRIAPGSRLAAIVYSHSDADHATGAPTLMAAFDQTAVPIIAQERAVDPIRARGNPEQPEPTVTFAERMMFTVNGRAFELHYAGAGHTDNSLIGFVPHAGVAFAVDFINNDRVGYQDMPGWQFPEFFDCLTRMLSIPFETVVFGHRDPGDRGTVHRQIAYYDDLRMAVRRAIAAGMTEDETAEHIELPAYAHFDQYENWLPLNARAIYRWLAGSE